MCSGEIPSTGSERIYGAFELVRALVLCNSSGSMLLAVHEWENARGVFAESLH